MRGGAYWVKDELLQLPPRIRKLHPRRGVIVISREEDNADPEWPTVLVIPTSSEPEYVTPHCHRLSQIKANDGGPLWARVPAVQFVMKEELEDRYGLVEHLEMEQLVARLLHYIGEI